MLRPDIPYNDLPLLPPAKDLESVAVLKKNSISYPGFSQAKEIVKTIPSGIDSANECAWNVQFEGGVSYKHNSFQKYEEQVEITFAGIEKEEVRGLVNTLFHSETSAWKDNNSKYEPIDGGPGCYYEIIENDDTIKLKLKYSCGC